MAERKCRQQGKMLLAGLFLGVCLMLTACGGRGKWIFSLRGEKVYRRQAMVYGLIYAQEYNVNDVRLLEKEYGQGETYGEYYKKEVEEEILSSVLLYGEAKEKGHTLTKEQKQSVRDSAQEFLDSCEQDWLKRYKIGKEDVEKVYEWKFLGDSYLEQLSEGTESNPAVSDEVEDEGVSEGDGNQQEHYIKVYEVVFPTVELGEDGMIQSNPDGTVKELAVAEKKKRKEAAEAMAEQGQSGKDLEKLSDNAASPISGMEKVLNYNNLEPAYRRAVDSLSQGRVSDVIESEYGFYVIQLLDKEDTDYAEAVAEYRDKMAAQDKRDSVIDELFEEYIRDDRDYKNKEIWEQIEFTDFLQK